MTIRDRRFWIYLFCIALIGVGVWIALFLTIYHPVLEMKNNFIVLETDYWSLSLQWPRGEIGMWFSTPGMEWRVWPP